MNDHPPMARLTDLKISLAKRILESSDEEQLRMMHDLMEPSKQFRLSESQKKELDDDLEDHKAGKGRSYSWSEVKAHVRRKRS